MDSCSQQFFHHILRTSILADRALVDGGGEVFRQSRTVHNWNLEVVKGFVLDSDLQKMAEMKTPRLGGALVLIGSGSAYQRVSQIRATVAK
jgi:hypothetical protein